MTPPALPPRIVEVGGHTPYRIAIGPALLDDGAALAAHLRGRHALIALEGQQAHAVKTPAHGGGGHQLARERATHRQHGGQARLQRPGPEGHGDHAKSEAREALHKSGGDGAQGDDPEN